MRTLVKLRIGCHIYVLKLVDTIKSLSMKGYVLSVVVIKLWTKPSPAFSIVRDIPL